MSRLSFIIAVLAFVYLGCICTVSSVTIINPKPIDDGDFLQDFFGSDTSDIIPAADRESAQALIKANHNIPRFTFFSSNSTLERVPSYFCSPRNYTTNSGSGPEKTYDMDSCNWSAYAESLLIISFVAFVIAIIVFPFLFCGLSLGRCCCCGKYRPTPTLCCGDPEDFEPTTNGYTDCSVLVLFILSIACCLVMAAGAGVGIWGSTVMTDNVIEMAQFINRTGNTFADIVDDVLVIIRSVGGMDNVSMAIDNETLFEADDLSGDIRNISSAIENYADIIDMPRRIFMYITLFLPLALMLLVIISRFLCWWLSWGMTFCGFILTFLSLLTFGVLYPMSSGLADICVFLDDALVDPESDNFINSVFKCSESSVLGLVSDMVEGVFEIAGNVSCAFYDEVGTWALPCDRTNKLSINISDPQQTCPFLTFKNDTENCTFATLANLADDARIFDRQIGCYCLQNGTTDIFNLQENTCGTLNSLYFYDKSKCPETKDGQPCMPLYCLNKDDKGMSFIDCNNSCKDDSLKTNSSFILDYTRVAGNMFKLYNDRIKPYLNCESIAGVTNHAKDFICVHMVNAVTPMFIGEILGAVGCFVGTFVALLSTKRFHKKYRRKYAILKEGQTAIEL